MRRREIITLIGSATVAWPIASIAQEAGRTYRLGILFPFPREHPSVVLLMGDLRRRGFIDGQNLTVNYRVFAQHPELIPEYAAQLIKAEADVLLIGGPESVAAARNATNSIPIVAVDLESDPVAMGYVKSLARPGGNMTGMFLDLPELSGKQVGLLKEIVPRLSRIAVFGIPGLNAAQFAAAETAARTLAVEAEISEVRVADDFERALEAARTRHVGAGILLSSPLVFDRSKQIGELALAKRLPLISLFAEFPKSGGLIAYGPNLGEIVRRSGDYVAKILHGAKPSDLPIQRPERFDLVINLKTATALGLDIPAQLQQLADEVIE